MNEYGKMYLKTSDERKKLLKAGFTEKEIENLYIMLNNFIFLNVDWQNDA
ncbi:MAG: hypothetical protein OIN66_15765 [Candidatus Methanoperedens sp.]|nr:hypothetical protein [Candidatus Methanoperedens sp.]